MIYRKNHTEKTADREKSKGTEKKCCIESCKDTVKIQKYYIEKFNILKERRVTVRRNTTDRRRDAEKKERYSKKGEIKRKGEIPKKVEYTAKKRRGTAKRR